MCCTVGKAFSRDYSTAEKWKNKIALGKKKSVFISQSTENLTPSMCCTDRLVG